MFADLLRDLGEDVPDYAAMSEREVVDELHAIDAALRRIEARAVALVDHVERSAMHTVDGHRSVAAWLRANARWSGTDALARVRLARLVRDVEPAAVAFAKGEVGVAQARELARAFANPRCGHQLGEVIDVLLAHHDTLEFDGFRTAVEHWEAAADMDGAHRDADAAHRRRHCSMRERDGELHVSARGTGLSAAVLRSVWEQYVAAEFDTDWHATVAVHGDDARADLMPRTAAQRAFDALVAMAHTSTITPMDGTAAEPLVNLVVDVTTAHEAVTGWRPDGTLSTDTWFDPENGRTTEHVNDTVEPAPAIDPFTRVCATIDGFPIPPGDALAAMWWGQVRKVVRDPSGVVIDLGRSRRLFTGPARKAVLLQSTRCTWPGCRVPIHRCQADHLHEHHRGGPTDQANAAPLCGHHNRFKHHHRYRVTRDPTTGRLTTTRPDGTQI